MEVYKYWCSNLDCLDKEYQHIQKNSSDINKKEICLTCRRPLKLMGEVVYGNVGSKFAIATPAQRKEMLLKRSKQHFKTSGLANRKKDVEHTMRQDIIKRFKEK